ncbi:hypothetical protein Taro_014468 [Colocasia esculenta]|uniref:Uncharacterized protein n=1 Tax=Colocasia esculenta TaxID=4460 RepID=A0A843ULX0_COLES|nr:hypothetical protein [Colocasia esculenta]
MRRLQEEYGQRDFMRPQRDGRNTLIDQLQGQLASLEVQLIEARAALETLRATQLTGGRAGTAGASSSRGAPAPEVASLQQQLSAAVERAERDLLSRSEELRDALSRETGTAAELTQLRSQLTQQGSELPREVSELQVLLSLERRDLERQQTRWEQERGRWELERRELAQQCVEARTSQGVAERLLKASEERYRCGRERARE